MMRRSSIALVDVGDLVVSAIFGWIVKEILDYAKNGVKNRLHLRGSFHLKCLIAIALLRTVDALLRALRWQDQALKLAKPLTGWSVFTLITAKQKPRFAKSFLSDLPIYDFYKFQIRI